MKSIGIDVGSTTAKMVIVSGDRVLYECYEKHFSQVRQKAAELIGRAKDYIGGEEVAVAISGSSGLGIAKATGIPFVQEVFATAELVRKREPMTDVVIELGGEDAKILFFDRKTDAIEERMNGSCAGGTGAFIDQMATLLGVTAKELDDLSLEHKTIYQIASRCGVFAKTDIQPLINQGARKEDIAASIFQAVVDQTITGLAQGHKIKGKVMFLGGPLYFLRGLRGAFQQVLRLSDECAIFPEYALYAVALGSALFAEGQKERFTWEELVRAFESAADEPSTGRLMPLFESEEEYREFKIRHEKASVEFIRPEEAAGGIYLGIDCGSTTTKLVAIDDQGRILYHFYNSNEGDPVEVVKKELIRLYELLNGRKISGAVSTGYGEELVKNAFFLDGGVVETIAHLEAARHFNKDVDFVIDIGGQDIKCFKIKNGAIDDIILNEACSSGCGSFLETFAKSLGQEISEFAKAALFAKGPVDLGSRCTVFMNSSVKQAQKEGADVGEISAGLSLSVVKNAIYKVIRAPSAKGLGKNIVVQGGTFLNDAVLRAFERETGAKTVRPQIAGLMGAYGAALQARSLGISKSGMRDLKSLLEFTHETKPVTCGLCNNRCNITISVFEGGGKYLSGNRCERPTGRRPESEQKYNLFAYKLKKIADLKGVPGRLGKIGIPMGLNMYENIFFWHALLTELGFEVVKSRPSSRSVYRLGQDTIPSDTVCYPAKLMHGHVQSLIDEGITRIFYPCLPYNFDEKTGDNHYNCPVVAYYPELLAANMDSVREIEFYSEYFGIHRPKDFKKKGYEFFREKFGVDQKSFGRAVDMGYAAHEEYRRDIEKKGREAIAFARANGKKIAVLAGRPYHVDGEINHGIPELMSSLGFVVITEDSIPLSGRPENLKVLNQWTYHARLYNAARRVANESDMEFIQIVSFGCGLDAITSDETRAILESGGKLYTQLKIDEINNLSAVKIRLRSLIAAAEQREKYEHAI